MQEQEDINRQAQLRMAAEVLVEWVHARRATWSEEPLGASELGDFSELSGLVLEAEPPTWSPSLAAPPSVSTVPPVLADAPSPEDSPLAFDIAALFDAEPPVPETKKPWERLRIQTEAVRSFAAPLMTMARRAAPATAVLAVIIGAGWMALPYVVRIKTWGKELADKATAPDAEPVVAKTTAPPRKAARTGELTARSEPPGAKVLVDGRDRGVTPVTLDDVTIGLHTVVLQSERGSVRRTVTVASDRAAVVSEAIFAGWLSVFAPFELQITEGTHVIRLDDIGTVLMSPGPHDLRLENRDLGYSETRRVEVQPGQTTSLSLVASPSTLTVTASAPAVVSIDGQVVGETPLTNHPIPLGTRDIVVKSGDGTERRFTQKITVAPVQIDVDFSKP